MTEKDQARFAQDTTKEAEQYRGELYGGTISNNLEGRTVALNAPKTGLEKLGDIADKASKSDDGLTISGSDSDTLTAREKAVVEMVASREHGNPDAIYGDPKGKPGQGKFSKEIGYNPSELPLSKMNITQVRDLQDKLVKATRGTLKHQKNKSLGTSAVGTGQFIRSTMDATLDRMGVPKSQWGNTIYTKDLQDKMLISNFKSTVGDPNDPTTWDKKALGTQWESFDTKKGYKPLSASELGSVTSIPENVDLKGTEAFDPFKPTPVTTVPVGTDGTIAPQGYDTTPSGSHNLERAAESFPTEDVKGAQQIGTGPQPQQPMSIREAFQDTFAQGLSGH
jgi:hypothetical protein